MGGTTVHGDGARHDSARAPGAEQRRRGYSTLSAGTITTGTPLADGASLNVQFALGIETTGTFRFYIIIEALP